MKDYYKILKLTRSAKHSEIRSSYRKLALEFHPDVNSSENAHEIFVSINEAYAVLKNVATKVRYDKLYDVSVLKKTPRNETKYSRKKNRRSEYVKYGASKGRNRARANAQAPKPKYEKEEARSWWGEDAIFYILEFVTTVFLG